MASTFRMYRLPESEARIEALAIAMRRYELQPSYQRQSDVWGDDKRALFIDSLINGYDVPKLYFHRLSPSKANSPTYAIVDGKQRLEAVRAFLENKFPLSEDFVDSENADSPSAGGKTFSALTRENPKLAGRFTRRTLDIVVIETADLEVIEELFSRLNEAVPLNAPEKRNAFGGAMPPVIRRLVADHEFFTDRLPIENTRYRQYDLVTKFLYLAAAKDFVAVKKRDLDEFVRRFTKGNATTQTKEANLVASAATKVLDKMCKVFESQDALLGSVGLVTVYFMAFLLADKKQGLRKRISRKRLQDFDHLRRHNRLMLRQQQTAIAEGQTPPHSTEIRTDLAIFDRLMQSPNDGQALEYRFRILEAFLEDRRFKGDLPAALRERIGE